HVFQRMDGEVRASLAHRHFELLDENALAADRSERTVDDAVALCRHAEQLDRARWIKRLETRAHMLCLPQRKRRLARRDHETARRMKVVHRGESGGAASVARTGLLAISVEILASKGKRRL